MPTEPFVNPYSFVSFGSSRGGDGTPPSHDHASGDTLHGTIQVTVEAVNPLLILDESTKAAVGNLGHFTYGIRKGLGEEILIPPTSMKGSLRSSYEAITDSRVGTPVSEMSRRLGYRKAARDAAKLTPARVLKDDEGNRFIQILRGHSNDPRAQRVTFSAAAFVSARKIAKAAGAAIEKLEKGDIKELKKYLELHGKEVEAELEPFAHYHRGRMTFEGWRVCSFRIDNKKIRCEPMNGDSWRRLEDEGLKSFTVTGWLMLTGWKNAQRKHEERFVFDTEISSANKILLTDELQAMWTDVMTSYLNAHDLRANQEPSSARGNGLPPRTFYSAHLIDKTRRVLEDNGVLWAKIDEDGLISELHPVAIGRNLYKLPPIALMPDHVRPPTKRTEFSPADRLFGFVASEKLNVQDDQAWKGGLTISHIAECSTPSSPETIRAFDGAGKSLKVLGAPKPQQGRFYTSQKNGEQTGRVSRAAKDDYSSIENQTLRGRKMYWHHQKVDWMQSDLSWSRPEGDSQNRSIREWIEPGTTFIFSLHVHDVLRTDLSALVWLLVNAMGDNAAHLHLGYGAPLGFGSLKVKQIDVQIENSDQLRWRWMGLHPLKNSGSMSVGHGNIDSTAVIKELCTQFEDSVKDESNQFPRHILEYLRIRRGFEHVFISYPRSQENENGYEWFVENARRENQEGENGSQMLPMALDEDPRLHPFAPSSAQGNQGRQRQGGRESRADGRSQTPRGGKNHRGRR